MRKRIICLGTFDGVHLGHQKLVATLRYLAQEWSLEPLIISFSPNPRKVLRPEAECHFLNTYTEKEERLASLGIDYAIIPFTRDLAKMPTRDFMLYLQQSFDVGAILMGYDHRFGAENSKDFSFYKAIAQDLGLKITQDEALSKDSQVVSSTYIRSLLLSSQLDEANLLLGYPYELSGRVENGLHIGRLLGYPTANISLLEADKLLPADGVYAVEVIIQDCSYQGMLYIGNRPTLERDLAKTIEVNIFDFAQDIYTQELKLKLHKYIRGEEKFASFEALSKQIKNDEESVRTFFNHR